MSYYGYDGNYYEDYYKVQIAEAVEMAEQTATTDLSGASGTASGQIAIYNGAAFQAGNLTGDSNGVSVSTVTSPAFGLQVALQQNLKTTASPTFNGLTLTTLAVGSGGTTVRLFKSGTFTADPGSIPATSTGTVDVTISGLSVGDMVILMRPNGLNDGLIYSGCRVQTTDTLRIYLYNPTAGAIDDGSLTWEYLWIDLTA